MKNNEHISLEKIGNKKPFEVPENYFEQFANLMDDEIGYKTSNHRYIRPWMYFAAAFVGIFLFSQVFYSVYQKSNISTTENYESYVLSQVDESAMIDFYIAESEVKN